MKALNIFFIAFCILLASACSHPDNKQSTELMDLKLRFEAGKKFTYNVTSQQHVKQTVNQQKLEIDNEIGLRYAFQFTDRTDSHYKASTAIEKIAITMNDGAQQISYDSDAANTDPSSLNAEVDRMFGKLKGQHFTTLFDTFGNMRHIFGLTEIIKNLQSGLQGAQQMGFSDETLTQHFAQAINIYPGKPVKAGDTWQTADTVQMQGLRVLASKKFRLSKVANNSATIAIQTQFKHLEGQTIDPRLTIELRGSQEGLIEIETSSGLIKTGKFSGDMDITISGGGQK